MVTKSITEARKELSALIELARQGEDVVIIKDSRPVASLRPIVASDLALIPEISDSQAERLLKMAKAGPRKTFRSAAAATAYLKREISRRR
jgi:prevent-host-death family protein